MNNFEPVDYLQMLQTDSDAYIGKFVSVSKAMTYYNMSWNELLTQVEQDFNLNEFIPAHKPCKMYFDFDAEFSKMTYEERTFFSNKNITEIITYISAHLKDFCKDSDFAPPNIVTSTCCTADKLSAHIVITNIVLPTNKHRKAFYLKFIDYIGIDNVFINKMIDPNVYNLSDKPMKMRMINQSKLSNNVPLVAMNGSIEDHIITYVKNTPLTVIPEEWIPVLKVRSPRPEEDLENRDVDINELAALLKRNTKNEAYKDWSVVGQVLYNLTNASDGGLKLFIDWSSSAHNFDEAACINYWEKIFKLDDNYNSISILRGMMNEEEERPRLLPPLPVQEAEVVEITEAHWTDTIIDEISDMYCAEIFAEHCEGEVFYTKGYDWIIFDKKTKFWSFNNTKTSLIYPISKFFSDNMKEAHMKFVANYDPKNETDNKTLKLIMKTRKHVESSKFAKNIIDHLQNLVTKDNSIIDDFDNHPNLIAFKNGYVIDLHNEGKSRPITKEDKLITHTGYNIPTKNVVFYNKIYDIIRSMIETDDDMKSLLSLLSTFIYGDNANEIFIVLTGSGGNGKGVIDRMLMLALGGYYKTIDIKQLTTYEKDGGKRPNSELYNCRLARCVMTSEPETGSTTDKLITSTIKKWTGKDPITCRDLNKSSITFTPKFTLSINVNEIPSLSTKDGGIERRMKCYELPFKFVQNQGQELHEKEKYRNDDLKTLLATEEYRDQIILVLIDAWLENKGKFYECSKVKEFTSNYLNEQNPVKGWFDEHYEVSESNQIPSNELYNEYKNLGNNISPNSFGRYMKEFCKMKRNNGAKYCCIRKLS